MEPTTAKWKVLSLPFFRFLILSAIGILVFMIPVPWRGGSDLPLGIMRGMVRDLVPSANRGTVIVAFILAASLITIINVIFKPGFIRNHPVLNSVFSADKIWGTCRILAGVFALIAYLQIGPQFLWNSTTGGMILNEVLVAMLPWFIVTGIFIPFLTAYGAMEFFGTILRPLWRPLFKLPGRSAIDCISSVMMSATVAALITDDQYVAGQYSKREAYVIAMCFSLASYPGVVFTLDLIGMNHYFATFYFSLLAIMIACAVIMPRMWPFKKMPDTYYTGESKLVEDSSDDKNLFSHAIHLGINAAARNARPSVYVKTSGRFLLGLVFNTLPAVMTIGAIGMILVHYTPIFQLLSYPLYLILSWAQIPHATEAAPALLIGFAFSDLPSFMMVADGITAPLTLFVVWVVAYSQIIFMAGVGAILMAAKMEVSLWYLVKVFLIRTAISLPLAIALGHLFFG